MWQGPVRRGRQRRLFHHGTNAGSRGEEKRIDRLYAWAFFVGLSLLVVLSYVLELTLRGAR